MPPNLFHPAGDNGGYFRQTRIWLSLSDCLVNGAQLSADSEEAIFVDPGPTAILPPGHDSPANQRGPYKTPAVSRRPVIKPFSPLSIYYLSLQSLDQAREAGRKTVGPRFPQKTINNFSSYRRGRLYSPERVCQSSGGSHDSFIISWAPFLPPRSASTP